MYHIHDSDRSIFLGTHVSKDVEYDLYFANQGHMPTVIARYGSEGSDYISGLSSSQGKFTSPPLVEARIRAEKKGYLSPNSLQHHMEGNRDFICKTTDNWYPSLEGGYVMVSFFKMPDEGLFKVSVGGLDDFSVAYEGDEATCNKIFSEIIILSDVTIPEVELIIKKDL